MAMGAMVEATFDPTTYAYASSLESSCSMAIRTTTVSAFG
jgi:hypothetical protein